MRFFATFFLVVVTLVASAQPDSAITKKRFADYVQLSGYIKEMQSFSFLSLDSIISDNLIHNRINLHFTPGQYLTGALELRNRIFLGERIRLIPNFGTAIAQDNGIIDLSEVWVDKRSFVALSNIDRAYVNYGKGKWNIRLGRQRINWGVNLVWNPNDLFNTLNFLDFDYEERAGTDGLRLQYYTGELLGIELAVRPGRGFDKTVAAGMFKFNKKGYDFQLLGGNYYKDIALGGGWAGNIKGAGFKGEATWFQPRELFLDTIGSLSASISADYAFPNTIYLHGSMLYNSSGLTSLSSGGFLTLASAFQSAKNLMPTKYSYFLQVSGSINPLTRADIAGIYGAGLNILFLMPSITYSIKENWDISLITQLFYAEFSQNFSNQGNYIFLRLKWSY